MLSIGEISFAGWVFLALPSLESLQAATASKSSARRFVCVSLNYGMNPGGFFPEQTGSDYVMPTLLKPLERHKRDLTVFSNLDHPEVGGGHGCSNTLLNGVESRTPRKTSKTSLGSTPCRKDRTRHSFSFLRWARVAFRGSRAGVRLPTMGNPREIFAELFLEDNPKLKAKRKQCLARC